MAYTERYVTQAAGGGGDGSSGSPWTLAEALTNAAAEDRVNIQSDSAYTLAADSITNAGTGWETMIIFRGYNSTIGDLDGVGRNSNTELNTTNMPDITLTGSLTPNNWTCLQNLYIHGSLSASLIAGAAPDNIFTISCRIVNTANNASAQAAVYDNSIMAVNSDFECTGATHGSVVEMDNQGSAIFCRFKGTSSTAALFDTRIGYHIIGNAFLSTGGTGIDVDILNANTLVIGNTFYNVGTAVLFPNATAIWNYVIFINNHCTDSTTWIDNGYSATADLFIMEFNTRTRDLTTPRVGIRADSVNASEVTTDTGGASTDYVDAPNGDITLISTAPAVDEGMGI
jgi:hypothetical protein